MVCNHETLRHANAYSIAREPFPSHPHTERLITYLISDGTTTENTITQDKVLTKWWFEQFSLQGILRTDSLLPELRTVASKFCVESVSVQAWGAEKHFSLLC